MKIKRYILQRSWLNLKGKIPDEKFLIEFTINLTQYGIPGKTRFNIRKKITLIKISVLAIIFMAIYFFCGIFYVYFDPKYNF